MVISSQNRREISKNVPLGVLLGLLARIMRCGLAGVA